MLSLVMALLPSAPDNIRKAVLVLPVFVFTVNLLPRNAVPSGQMAGSAFTGIAAEINLSVLLHYEVVDIHFQDIAPFSRI